MLLRARCRNAKEGPESRCVGAGVHGGADLWEEAGTALAQKMAGEIHPGKSRLLNTLARALFVQGWRGLLSEEPSN